MKKVYVRITKQIGFSYLSTIMLFLVSPLLVLLLTRTLTVAEYGIYSILAITVNVAGVLLDLGLSQYIMSRLSGISPIKRARSFFTLSTFIMVFLISALAVILLTPLQGVLLSALRLTSYASEFRVALAIILCITLIRLFTAYLTAKKHMILVNIVFLLSQALWVVLLLAVYAFTRSITLLSVMTWWFAGVLVTMLACGWMIRREFTHTHPMNTWKPEIIFEGLLFSLPLLFFITGSWSIEVGNRYLLNGILGSEAVALFTLVYSLLGVVASFGSIVSQTFFPYIASAWNQRKNYSVYLNISIKYSLMVVVPAIAGFLAMRSEIITLVSGQKYLEAASVIPWLLAYPLFAALNYVLYQIVLLKKRTVFIGIIYVIGAVINIMLNLFLIPRFRMAGAAVSTVISYAFVFALLVFASGKSLQINYSFLKPGRIILASALMGIAVSLVHPMTASSKILTMIGGAVLYFIILFATKTFSPEERSLVPSILPMPFRKLAQSMLMPKKSVR